MKGSFLKKGHGRSAALYLGATGLFAGFINGLLGAGGGIPVVFALSKVFQNEDGDSRDLYANALCIMLPVSMVSCIRYAVAGNLQTVGFGMYALPAIAGGLAGGFLLGRLKGIWLKKLFGMLVIWAGILMILR